MRIGAKARAKKLTRQTAVVTGGGSGIGSMIASAYVQNGVKVYIASRKEEQLKKVCRAHHPRIALSPIRRFYSE
jgi:NADP-dependent 3-hydroxy acid dehydrogenase YdfG